MLPPTDVLLVNMPWAEVYRPSMQLGLLKAILVGSGIKTHTFYPNLRLAEMIRLDVYNAVDDMYRPTAEWLFSEAVFREKAKPAGEYLDYLRSVQRVSDDEIKLILEIKDRIDSFLDQCLEAVLSANPRIVAFTTAMIQTLPAAALARRIKEVRPDVITVIGGAACEGKMGVALMRALPCIDVAVRSECDEWVSYLFTNLLNGHSVENFPSLSWRDGNRVRNTALGSPNLSLDANPRPIFDDFFVQLDQSELAETFPRSVPFEGSRGCWWGERRHCAFCGLNGLNMASRTRNPEKVVEELVAHRAEYGVETFIAVDQILSPAFYNVLAPLLGKHLPGTTLFYEMTPSIPRKVLEDISSVVELHTQPGIESLSSAALKAMNKGLRGIQNVALLRRAKELGIHLLWNIIIGIPGESAEELADGVRHFAALAHFQPPNLLPLTLARFSPYFDEPERYNIRINGPRGGLGYAYPVPPKLLEEIVWAFEFEYLDGYNPNNVAEMFSTAVEGWKERYPTATLSLHETVNGSIIRDTRLQKAVTYRLDAYKTLLCKYLESPRSLAAVAHILFSTNPNAYLKLGGKKGMNGHLSSLYQRGLVWKEDDLFVALVVPQRRGFWLNPQSESSKLSKPTGESQPFKFSGK